MKDSVAPASECCDDDAKLPKLNDEQLVNLQVRIADAQGLKLLRGGEVRLVLTLRADDDPEGGACGSKVTPWLAVPEDQAPLWRARGTAFQVPAERLLQASFRDSAHVHISLWQRGHSNAEKSSVVAGFSAATSARSLALLAFKQKGIASALQHSASNISWLGVGAGDRGEMLASLSLPVADHLVASMAARGVLSSTSSWVELLASVTDGGCSVKGSLLLELGACAAAPIPTPSVQQEVESSEGDGPGLYIVSTDGTALTSGLVPSRETIIAEMRNGQQLRILEVAYLPELHRLRARTETPAGWISLLDTASGMRWARKAPPTSPALESSSLFAPSNSSPAADVDDALAIRTSAACESRGTTSPVISPGGFARGGEDEPSDNASSEGAATSEFSVDSHRASSSSSTAATKHRQEDEQVTAAAAEFPLRLLLPHASSTGDRRIQEALDLSSSSAKWRPFGNQSQPSLPEYNFDGVSKIDIFAASEHRGSDRDRVSKLLQGWSRRPIRLKALGERLRCVIDPAARRQHEEVRKWRKWHDAFCALNEIERRLAEVLKLLKQAAASMQRFGDSHGRLFECIDGVGVAEFLRDAGLYHRSESEVPKRLEKRLDHLEKAANEFRVICLEAGDAASCVDDGAAAAGDVVEEQLEWRRICDDLQVDVVVLLESALMAAQQALAEYKKLHCRLELLATEYDSACRLEIDTMGPHFFTFFSQGDSPEGADAGVPDRAVQWAVDFSRLVGSSSRGLQGLVKELDHQGRQLKSCSTELRDYMLQSAACTRINGLVVGPVGGSH